MFTDLVVVHDDLCSLVLPQPHRVHPVIRRMKPIAGSCIHVSNIDEHIENLVRKCAAAPECPFQFSQSSGATSQLNIFLKLITINYQLVSLKEFWIPSRVH